MFTSCTYVVKAGKDTLFNFLYIDDNADWSYFYTGDLFVYLPKVGCLCLKSRLYLHIRQFLFLEFACLDFCHVKNWQLTRAW